MTHGIRARVLPETVARRGHLVEAIHETPFLLARAQPAFWHDILCRRRRAQARQQNPEGAPRDDETYAHGDDQVEVREVIVSGRPRALCSGYPGGSVVAPPVFHLTLSFFDLSDKFVRRDAMT